MSPEQRDVTPAELGVLEQLWETQPQTIRELALALYGEDTPSSYATVQKLLDRLEAKGHVQRTRAGRAHRFTPRIAREDLIDRRLRDLADQLCEGSLTPLLTQLVEGSSLSDHELDALKARIRRLDRQRREGR